MPLIRLLDGSDTSHTGRHDIICVREHIHLQVCVLICLHTLMCLCMYMYCVLVCLCACVLVCLCACVLVCLCACVFVWNFCVEFLC